jgi:hypothetical protein
MHAVALAGTALERVTRPRGPLPAWGRKWGAPTSRGENPGAQDLCRIARDATKGLHTGLNDESRTRLPGLAGVVLDSLSLHPVRRLARPPAASSPATARRSWMRRPSRWFRERLWPPPSRAFGPPLRRLPERRPAGSCRSARPTGGPPCDRAGPDVRASGGSGAETSLLAQGPMDRQPQMGYTLYTIEAP